MQFYSSLSTCFTSSRSYIPVTLLWIEPFAHDFFFFFSSICFPLQADYYTCIATIVYLRKENCLYQACPSQDCNKKVVDQHNGMFRCEKCDKEFPNFKYRLILSVSDSARASCSAVAHMRSHTTVYANAQILIACSSCLAASSCHRRGCACYPCSRSRCCLFFLLTRDSGPLFSAYGPLSQSNIGPICSLQLIWDFQSQSCCIWDSVWWVLILDSFFVFNSEPQRVNRYSFPCCV